MMFCVNSEPLSSNFEMKMGVHHPVSRVNNRLNYDFSSSLTKFEEKYIIIDLNSL